MSYTNSTTHYHIPLPTQTDLVNGLDWNDSSEAIDTAVYDASQAAGAAAGDIVTIKQDIVDLKAEDVLIEQAATELTGRVATLEQNATLDEQAIQDVADMITDKEVSQAQSDVHVNVDEWFRYNGVLYVCTVEINIGDTIIPNTNCRATNIEDEMPSGGNIDADDVGYDNTTSGLTAEDVQEAIDELKGLIDQIGGSTMKCAMYGLETDVTGSTDRVVDISSLNLQSAEDYMVILNCSIAGNTDIQAVYLTAKTATSFSIKGVGTVGIPISYQVITFV